MKRTRNYTFVVYPDSLPANWLEILEQTHVPIAISPLHDEDVNEHTGEFKKPHYHVNMYYSGPKTLEQVLETIKPLGVQFVEPMRDVSGCTRYLCHLDNPEKAQYPVEQITRLNGVVLDLNRKMSPSDVLEVVEAMHDYIDRHEVVNFADFATICRADPDWYYVLTSKRTNFFKILINAKRYQGDD
jgi:hypothetical protein